MHLAISLRRVDSVSLPHLCLSLDGFQQRVHGVRPLLRDCPVWILLQQWPVKAAKLHGPHVGREEWLTKLRRWSGMLHANSTIMSYTSISGLSGVKWELFSHLLSSSWAPYRLGRTADEDPLLEWSAASKFNHHVIHRYFWTFRFSGHKWELFSQVLSRSWVPCRSGRTADEAWPLEWSSACRFDHHVIHRHFWTFRWQLRAILSTRESYSPSATPPIKT